MWGLRSARTAVIAIAVAAFAVLCVLPVAYMIGMVAAVGASDAVFHLDTRQQLLLFNTVVLGGGTAVAATTVGAPLGFVLARVPLPLKALWRLLLAAPVVLPPYTVGLAWTFGAQSAGLPDTVAHGLPGAIAVLTIVLYPLPMLAAEIRLRQLESRLEEAALVVAPPGLVIRKVTVPLVAPIVFAAALIVFVLSTSDFAVPALLRVRVYPTEVFTAFAALYDVGRAAALALPLLFVSIAAALAASSANLGGMVVSRRGSSGAPPFAFRQWREPALVAAIGVVLTSLVVPVTVLAAEARRAESLLVVLGGSSQAVINSLVLAAVGATAVVAVAVCMAYLQARSSPRVVGRSLEMLWLVLFAVPSTIVGIGLIRVWNRPGMGMVYGTAGMLIVGYMSRFIPVAALVLSPTVRGVPVSHEEAAAVAGAGWLRTMLSVVVPQLRIPLIGAWLVVFVLAFGEIGTSILISPPGESTLPIRVYTLIANAPPGHVATLALFQAFVVLSPLALFGALVAVRDRA